MNFTFHTDDGHGWLFVSGDSFVRSLGRIAA